MVKADVADILYMKKYYNITTIKNNQKIWQRFYSSWTIENNKCDKCNFFFKDISIIANCV